MKQIPTSQVIAIMIACTFLVMCAESPPPPLRSCTFKVGDIHVAGALHEQTNGRFCIPYAE